MFTRDPHRLRHTLMISKKFSYIKFICKKLFLLFFFITIFVVLTHNIITYMLLYFHYRDGPHVYELRFQDSHFLFFMFRYVIDVTSFQRDVSFSVVTSANL